MQLPPSTSDAKSGHAQNLKKKHPVLESFLYILNCSSKRSWSSLEDTLAGLHLGKVQLPGYPASQIDHLKLAPLYWNIFFESSIKKSKNIRGNADEIRTLHQGNEMY